MVTAPGKKQKPFRVVAKGSMSGRGREWQGPRDLCRQVVLLGLTLLSRKKLTDMLRSYS